VIKTRQTNLDIPNVQVSSKVVNLVLAFSPEKKLFSHLKLWVKENVNPDAVLDISVDQSILAGALITYNGYYKDFSLKKKVQEAFSQNRKEIEQKLRLNEGL